MHGWEFGFIWVNILPNYSLREKSKILCDDANRSLFFTSFSSAPREDGQNSLTCIWENISNCILIYSIENNFLFYIIKPFVVYFKMIHMELAVSMPQTL